MPSARSRLSFRPSLAFVLMGVLLASLWLAGGASRGDVAGQAIVRTTAFAVLIVAALFGKRPVAAPVRAIWTLLGCAAALLVAQLIPLPEAVWRTFPNADLSGAVAGGEAWRRWSVAPGATMNALVSLVVPVAVLALLVQLPEPERRLLPGILLAMVLASMLLGLVQFSGVVLNNPLVNDTPGSVSATFANRNHFALFLAIGCLLVPVWMVGEGRQLRWRAPVGLGALLLFVLMILASGSRAGMAIGGVAMVIAAFLLVRGLRGEFRRLPRWVLPAVVAGGIALVASLVFVSVAADRAVSIDRSLSAEVGQDMRSRALPIVWDMTRAAFPLGSGLGSFDPVFRVYEPFGLLKPTYFNQAHNDFVEVVFGAGLPGLLLLVAALVWWGWRSIVAWRHPFKRGFALPQAGSAILLLVILSSGFDYAARTPLIMAVIVIAATWLSARPEPAGD